MHAFHLKNMDVLPNGRESSAGESPSPRWIGFTCAAMCTRVTSISNHSTIAARMIGNTFALQIYHRLECSGGWKLRGRRGFCGVGAETIVFVCVLRGCPSALGLLRREEARCGRPTVTSWALLPKRQCWAGGYSPSASAGLLTSRLIALTHQLLLLRGWSNLFIYWFPTGWRQH